MLNAGVLPNAREVMATIWYLGVGNGDHRRSMPELAETGLFHGKLLTPCSLVP
jgi:hypothetical protein